MKCSNGTLQNLPYFWNTKTYVVFFRFFISFYLTFFHLLMSWSMSKKTRAFIRGKTKVALNEKWKKLRGFSYSKSMANFVTFCWNISSSINILFLKSVACVELVISSAWWIIIKIIFTIFQKTKHSYLCTVWIWLS